MSFLPEGWSLERIFLVGTFFVSASAFIFGVGVNWARISDQDVRQTAFEVYTNATFVRSDVYRAEQQRLAESIERLNRNLERIEAVHYAPNERRPTVPTFGRQ